MTGEGERNEIKNTNSDPAHIQRHVNKHNNNTTQEGYHGKATITEENYIWEHVTAERHYNKL